MGALSEVSEAREQKFSDSDSPEGGSRLGSAPETFRECFGGGSSYRPVCIILIWAEARVSGNVIESVPWTKWVADLAKGWLRSLRGPFDRPDETSRRGVR